MTRFSCLNSPGSQILKLFPLFLLAGCSREPGERFVVDKAPLVATTTVVAAPAAQKIELSGTIRARNEVNLGFRLAGKIAQRLVDAGEAVDIGDPLYTLDAADYELQWEGAKAQEAVAKARLKDAADQLEHTQRLLEQTFVSAAQFDRVQAAFEQARAAHDAARAARENAANTLDYTTLRANTKGIVGEILGNEGQVVSAGQPVVVLAALDQLEAEVYLPERYIETIEVGDPATLSNPFSEDLQQMGTVREIAGSADPRTRTYRTRIALPETGPPLRLGASIAVTIHVPFPHDATLVKPEALCGEAAGNPFVWILGADQQTVAQPVNIVGTSGGDFVVTGLEPGNRIVTSGARFLHEATRVRIAATSTKE